MCVANRPRLTRGRRWVTDGGNGDATNVAEREFWEFVGGSELEGEGTIFRADFGIWGLCGGEWQESRERSGLQIGVWTGTQSPEHAHNGTG